MPFTLRFGALAPQIYRQLEQQSVRCSDIEAAVIHELQKDADAITRLYGRLQLSAAERDRMRRAILRKVKRLVVSQGRKE